MKQQFHLLVKAFLLLFVFIFGQSFFHKGGDYFKVLLNGKMVAEQYLTHPAAIKSLSLNNANQNDRLAFYYSHCGKLGTNRAIALKNDHGNVLKEWKFSDARLPEMQISVKEVLKASSNLNSTSVYYISNEIPNGKLLINLHVPAAVAKN